VQLGYGSAPAVLAEIATNVGAAVIVTGVARYNQLRDFVLGTAVDHLLRRSPAPVLVVKQRAEQPYRRILVATDYSEGSQLALQTALRLFPQADVELLHGYDVPFESRHPSAQLAEMSRGDAEAGMRAFVEAAAPADVGRIRTDVRKGGILEILNGKVAQDQADLVVIGAHGASGWRQATLGSVASELLRTTPVDALVVKRPG
jgi:nucleotide-binding universal stress UspA family protein